MVLEGCSGLSRNDYLSKSEKEHLKYCEGKGNPFDPLNGCSNAEGCKYMWFKKGGKKCTLNVGGSLSNSYINGGFGFGKLCLSREFTRLILLILFPPFYIFLNEKETGFKNKGALLMNFILTCLFYFPGLIHALMYKDKRKRL